MPPSIVTHLDHIVVVLRQRPAPVTSSSLSTRADETLPRPQLVQELEGRHRVERVLNTEVSYVRVLGSVGPRRRSTTSTTLLSASAFGLRGYVDTLSPLISMHLLDRSCMVVGIFLKYCVPQHWHQSQVYA